MEGRTARHGVSCYGTETAAAHCAKECAFRFNSSEGAVVIKGSEYPINFTILNSAFVAERSLADAGKHFLQGQHCGENSGGNILSAKASLLIDCIAKSF